MKQGNLTKWIDIEGCTNLLLFSQLVNELLFNYSIPSNRVSTLNSHYLCLDALSAIDGIENHGVPDATLKPIMEELYRTLSKDPVFDGNTHNPMNYFVKYNGDKYVLSSKIQEMNYNDLRKTAHSLDICFFKEDNYYVLLKEKITEIIKSNNIEKQRDLFRMVKSMLTELMNYGYSHKYIQDVMTEYYWNSGKDIKNPDCIDLFFSKFDMEKKEYDVVFIVHKNRIEKLASYIDGVEFDVPLEMKFKSHSEKQFFTSKNKDNRNAFLIIHENALDPYSAATMAKYRIEVDSALYRLYDHDYRYDINSARCAVYDDERFYSIDSSISALEHTRTMSNRQIKEGMSLSNKALEAVVKKRSYDDFLAIINAARFHSNSLDSKAEENQLLDLWAIFESVLNISNEHTSDRINQVCMYLVPILKKKYIYSLFEQLAQDMKNYDEKSFKKIIMGIKDEGEIVQTICEFVLLEEKQKDRELYLKNCADFPLLKERIEYYSSSLQSSMQVYEYIEKHGECVKWQIMRIYRNRNLIIHNAEIMPYLGLLIENLHSYVDDFLSYSISSLASNNDIEAMCQELFITECNRRARFQKGKQNMSSELIKEILYG